MSQSSADKRLTDLEIKLTYQDDLIRTLDQVVVELRGHIEQLQTRLKAIEDRNPEGQADGFRHEPPPHY